MLQRPFSMGFAPPGDLEEIALDVSAIRQIEAVRTLLEVICEITGMRFAAVAHVTDSTWTACVVRDGTNSSLKAGAQLSIDTTFCLESKSKHSPIVIEHASLDLHNANHPIRKLYQIESYVSVPIVLRDGRYFGNLCATSASSTAAVRRVVSEFFTDTSLVAVFRAIGTICVRKFIAR